METQERIEPLHYPTCWCDQHGEDCGLHPECEGEETICAECRTEWYRIECDKQEMYGCGCPVWAANDVGHWSLGCEA